MRLLILLLCLTATVAGARQPGSFPAQAEPGAPAEPGMPDWARPPPSQGPAQSAGERAARYSRFSAGPGGPAIVVAEVLLGLGTGAMLGASYDTDGRNSNAYSAAMISGLALGTAGTLYQYFVPVKRAESVMATTASLVGMMGAIGVANDNGMSDRDRAILAMVASQAGLYATLLLTAGGEDVSGSDVGLMTVTTSYAFMFTSLIEFISHSETGRGYNFTPVLLAPAVGMALGGLLAIPLELSAGRLLFISLIPLIPTSMAVALAAPLSNNETTGRVVLTTLTASFVLTSLLAVFTYEPPAKERASASSVEIAPMPVVLAAGRDNRSVAAGPGLFVRF
jgi:hypothetical protein